MKGNKEKILPDWDFEKSTKRDWVEVARKELKGKSLDHLIVTGPHGLISKPYYDQEDTISSVPLNFNKLNPEAEGFLNFYSLPIINGQESNSMLHSALQLGMDSISLIQEDFSPKELEASLNELVTEILTFEFQTPNADEVSKWILEERINLKKGALSELPSADILKELIDWSQEKDSFYPITLGSAGSTDYARENAVLVSKLVDLAERMESLGISHQRLFQKLRFRFRLDHDFFTSAAQLRAFKALLNGVLEEYNLERPSSIILHSIAASWKDEKFGPHESMLKGTTNVISAMIGGCNSIQVVPSDLNSELQRRIAWHTYNVLSAEALLEKVRDPGRGSYYFEDVTSQIIDKSLDIFKDLESKGGYHKAKTEP